MSFNLEKKIVKIAKRQMLVYSTTRNNPKHMSKSTKN